MNHDSTDNFPLTEKSYVEAAWFVPSEREDWMAMVYRDDPDSPWKARYRFRYHHPDTVGNDPHPGDKFSCYELKARDPKDESARTRFVGAMAAVAFMTAARWKSITHHVVVRGNEERFLDVWGQMPFVHTQVYAPAPSRPQ